MRRVWLGTFLAVGLLLLAAGCDKREPARSESETSAKSTDAQGNETVTETESKRVGSTMVATTETTTETEDGDETVETRTVVGTVTAYEPGKKIEVMTGNNKKHDFDLDDDDTTITIDPAVLVGTKVRLVQTEYEEGRKTLRAAPVMVLPAN